MIDIQNSTRNCKRKGWCGVVTEADIVLELILVPWLLFFEMKLERELVGNKMDGLNRVNIIPFNTGVQRVLLIGS